MTTPKSNFSKHYNCFRKAIASERYVGTAVLGRGHFQDFRLGFSRFGTYAMLIAMVILP
jgi:hypothetical protein